MTLSLIAALKQRRKGVSGNPGGKKLKWPPLREPHSFAALSFATRSKL
jgi:hypothetical protein